MNKATNKLKIWNPQRWIFILFLLLSQIAIAQTDSILVKDNLGKNDYILHNQKIKTQDVLTILEVHPEAYELFKSGTEANTFATIFGGLGIILIATPAIMSIAGNESNWSMAWAGAGLIVVSIPLFHKYDKNTTEALNLYNGTLPESKTAFKRRASLQMGFTANGAGISLRF